MLYEVKFFIPRYISNVVSLFRDRPLLRRPPSFHLIFIQLFVTCFPPLFNPLDVLHFSAFCSTPLMYIRTRFPSKSTSHFLFIFTLTLYKKDMWTKPQMSPESLLSPNEARRREEDNTILPRTRTTTLVLT